MCRKSVLVCKESALVCNKSVLVCVCVCVCVCVYDDDGDDGGNKEDTLVSANGKSHKAHKAHRGCLLRPDVLCALCVTVHLTKIKGVLSRIEQSY